MMITALVLHDLGQDGERDLPAALVLEGETAKIVAAILRTAEAGGLGPLTNLLGGTPQS